MHLDSTKLVSGSVDKTIKVWDIATGVCLYTLSGHHSAAVWGLKLTDTKMFTSSFDERLLVWDFTFRDDNADGVGASGGDECDDDDNDDCDGESERGEMEVDTGENGGVGSSSRATTSTRMWSSDSRQDESFYYDAMEDIEHV
jgi:WD40 repeat protein